MLEGLVEWTWLWRGGAAVVLASMSCALLGVFLYLRGMSMLTDALAHVALPGVAFAWLLTGRLDGATLLGGAAVMGVVSALLIEGLGRRARVREDAAIGIVFTALFAVGIVLLSTVLRDTHLDVACLLFGDLLGVSDRSLWVLGVTAPLTVLLVVLGWRALVAGGFDRVWSSSLVWPVALVQVVLLGWTAVVAAASFEAVGVVLVIGLFVLPAATAHLLVRRMRGMVAVSLVVGVLAALCGLGVAVWLDVAPSGTVVLVQGVVYTGALWWRTARDRAVVRRSQGT